MKRLATAENSRIFVITRNSDERRCALKFIEPDQMEIETIEKEIKVMMIGSKDQNGTILECIEAFDYKERIWVILELMERETLTILIEEHCGQYNEDFIRYVMLRIVQGIAFLHSQDVVHRDLKSDNILLNDSGEIKLTGFQFSALNVSATARRKTRLGSICWMAPEIVTGQEYT